LANAGYQRTQEGKQLSQTLKLILKTPKRPLGKKLTLNQKPKDFVAVLLKRSTPDDAACQDFFFWAARRGILTMPVRMAKPR